MTAGAGSIRVPDLRTSFKSRWQTSPPEERQVQQLIDQIDQLREQPFSHGTSAVTSLEQLLQRLPRRGVVVREGWLTLARREARRLHLEKAAGGTPDVTRLRSLNQEAERVTD